MAAPIEWCYGSVRVVLLSESESASFIKEELRGDTFGALTSIKEKLLARHPTELCLCVLEKEILYALVMGGAALKLVRGKHTLPLMKTLQDTASVISGKVVPGDILELELENSKYRFSVDEPQTELPNTPLRQKVASLIGKLIEKLPERRIVIQENNSKAKKASIIGIILLLILGISVYLGLQKREGNLRRAQYEPKLLQAQHDLSEGVELAPISRPRARELILRARSIAKELSESGIKDERLDKLLADLSHEVGSIAGIYETPSELFFDLTIVAPNFEGADLALSGGELRVLDSKGKRLVGLTVEGKKTEVIAGPEYLNDALATAAYEGRSFVLSSDGIREVTEDVELVVHSEWDAKNVLVEAFAGNLYVLDRENNQIWRYQGVTGGFLEKAAWLGEGFTKDVTGAVAWAIDGSIWTISQKGEFKVYSQGAPTTFSVSGQSENFGDIIDIYTSDESEYVYVLDRGRGVLAIITKTGRYIGEYVASELAAATRVAVDEEHRSVFFLAASKLYRLEARHLN